jgi:short-subunit dehydrogenase
VPVCAQEVGGVQFRRTKNARLVSCSVAATAKENALETAQRASAAPFNAFITGSTKGIGLALAEEFLRNGDNVIICLRSEDKE